MIPCNLSSFWLLNKSLPYYSSLCWRLVTLSINLVAAWKILNYAHLKKWLINHTRGLNWTLLFVRIIENLLDVIPWWLHGGKRLVLCSLNPAHILINELLWVDRSANAVSCLFCPLYLCVFVCTLLVIPYVPSYLVDGEVTSIEWNDYILTMLREG